MRRLYTAANLPEAHLLLHKLEAAGIDARVFNENAQGGLGELPFIPPEVWIERDEELVRARQIVEEYEKKRLDDRVIVCAACGEDNPASFELCWQCGAAVN